MRWTITENQECRCSGFEPDCLPETLPANLHVLIKKSQYYLRADGIAGIIPCLSGNSIYIEPKYSGLHPFVMYEYINDLSITQQVDDTVDLQGNDIDFYSLSQRFVNELIAIQCHQKLFKRLPVKSKKNAVKGRVDWSRTFRDIVMGRDFPIASTTLEATYDICENQVISMAAETCLPLFEYQTLEWRILKSWSDMSYTKPLVKKDLLRIQSVLRNAILGGAHSYYYSPLALALVILGIDEAGNTVNQDQSILFNMPGLYEDYIRTAFMRKCASKGYSCQKSFVPRSFLFTNGTCELEPDITIYSGTRPLAVLDVKYKTPDSKDYYQIFTYLQYAGLSCAYIVSPSVRHNEVITAYNGHKIINLNVSKSNQQLLENVASGVIDSL